MLLFFAPQQGILTDSVMFYGHYTNHTSGNYNIPLAYIFSIGTGMFVTCVMLVYRFVNFPYTLFQFIFTYLACPMIESDFLFPFSMSKSFGKSFCTFKTTGNLALKVFCSWDFKVCRKRSVKRQSVNICTQLKVCGNMT